MYTFKAEQSFTDEQIVGFSKFLGWTELVINQDDLSPIPNPETSEEYVKRKFIEHSLLFTCAWVKDIKDKELASQTAVISQNLEEVIVKPIADGFILTSEYKTEE